MLKWQSLRLMKTERWTYVSSWTSHTTCYSVLWSRDHGLETRVHSSSFCPGLGLGLETWSPRCRSWSQGSMLGAYACSTITVICSTFKRVLCHQLELMQPVLWSRDHGLETGVHFVQVSVSRPDGQGLGLET